MSEVPSNLIPTRITQLPDAPVASGDSLLMIVYQGNNYKIAASELLQVAGVPTSRIVSAGTGLSGGGQLSSNITLSIAPGGVGTAQLAASGATAGTYGGTGTVPVMTVDETGRVTAITQVAVTVTGYVPVTRSITAGAGLQGGGTLNNNLTLSVDFGDGLPLAGSGLGSAGVSTELSRVDHQHPAVDLSNDDEVDGILGLNNGGTARSIVPAAGAMVYSGADGLYVGSVGVAGQVVLSNGADGYAWGSALVVSDQPANVVYAGPASGPEAETTFRNLVIADLPASGVTAGNYGSVNETLNVSVNAQGQVTDLSTALIEISHTQVSGLGTAAVLDAGAASGVATLDGSGKVPTSQLPAAVIGGLNYQGTWDASTNTPTLVSSVGVKGHYYVVSVAGATNLNGVTDWLVGDWAVYNGVAWQKVDNTDAVASVNGYTGVVVLTYSDVGAPSATGTGASGTWGVNISGNAATVTSVTSGQVTTALGYTPYNATNPANYITSAGAPVQSVNGYTGTVVLAKADVGLSNVDNTSDANKPVSTATQTALNAKQDTLVSGTNIKTVNGATLLGSGDLIVDIGVASFNTRTGAVTLTSTDVTTALTYTPYNATNPAGYTTNTGTVTSVAGTGTVSGLSLSGTVTTSGSVTLGGTLAVTPANFASQTANTFLAAPDGAPGVPTFRAVLAADIPTLNQNTTGNAATATLASSATNLSGGVASNVVYQSGAGVTAYLANGTAGQVLKSAGASAPSWGGIDGGTF